MKKASTEIDRFKLSLHFDVHQPLSADQLAKSISAFSDEYDSFLLRNHPNIKDTQARLYINKIENNCILVHFISATDILGHLHSSMLTIAPFVEFTNSLLHMFETLERLAKSSKNEGLPRDINKKKIDNISDIINAINDPDGKLTFACYERTDKKKDETTTVKITLKSDRISDIRQGCNVARHMLDQRKAIIHQNLEMTFDLISPKTQPKNKKSEEKGIISSLSKKPVRINFVSDDDQIQLKSFKKTKNKNPLQATCKVDVEVEYDEKDRPKVYNILRIRKINTGGRTTKDKARKLL